MGLGSASLVNRVNLGMFCGFFVNTVLKQLTASL